MSINVAVTQSGTTPRPGVQLLLGGADATLELELENANGSLEGGIGTTGAGVPAVEGPQVWISAIGNGRTTRAADGRGEVLSGTLRGYLEIDNVTTACYSPSHTWALRAQ
jgi:hypothetical protein